MTAGGWIKSIGWGVFVAVIGGIYGVPIPAQVAIIVVFWGIGLAGDLTNALLRLARGEKDWDR